MIIIANLYLQTNYVFDVRSLQGSKSTTFKNELLNLKKKNKFEAEQIVNKSILMPVFVVRIMIVLTSFISLQMSSVSRHMWTYSN